MELRRLGVRVGKIAGTLVLVVLVAAFVVYAVPDVVGAEHSFVVLSGSMTPTIGPGDVVVDDNDPATIEEGDVITFVRPEAETPTTHRVIDVRNRDGQLAFKTKGDANEDPDAGVVPASNVVGTVMLTLPHLGHVVRFANTTAGMVLLLGLPFGLLVLSEVWSLAVSYRNSVAEPEDDSSSEPESNAGADHAPDADSTVESEPDSESGSESGSKTDTTETDAVSAAETATESSTEPTSTEWLHGTDTEAAVDTGTDTEADDDPGADTDTDDDDPDAETDTDANDGATLTVHPTDLTVTAVLLAVLVPYAGYVAVQLRTALAFTVAFAGLFSLLALGSLRAVAWLSARDAMLSGDDAVDGETSPDTATDGGSVTEGE